MIKLFFILLLIGLTQGYECFSKSTPGIYLQEGKQQVDPNDYKDLIIISSRFHRKNGNEVDNKDYPAIVRRNSDDPNPCLFIDMDDLVTFLLAIPYIDYLYVSSDINLQSYNLTPLLSRTSDEEWFKGYFGIPECESCKNPNNLNYIETTCIKTTAKIWPRVVYRLQTPCSRSYYGCDCNCDNDPDILIDPLNNAKCSISKENFIGMIRTEKILFTGSNLEVFVELNSLHDYFVPNPESW